jgi:hypothetical protein
MGADFSARCYASESLHSIRTLTLYAVLWCSEFSDWFEDCYRVAENCQSIEFVILYRNDFHKYFKKLREQIYILVEVKESNSAF